MRVLLAPVAFDQELAAPLAQGTSIVREEIARLLEARGATVTAPAPGEFQAAWASATQDLGRLRDAHGRIDLPRLDAASRTLFSDYRAHGKEFDVLLFVHFEVKQVQVRAWSASWDDVERRVPVDRSGGRRYSDLWPNDRDVPCLSIRAVAYTADGMRRFDRLAGLEVLSEFRTMDLAELPRRDLFQDRVAMRESVAIALAPLFQD
jgi:hypothetical protein